MTSVAEFTLRHDPRADASPRLDGWRANVGELVALDASGGRAGTAADRGRTAGGALLVLSWNVWIGRGRLREVVSLIRRGAFAHAFAHAPANADGANGATPEPPLVVLLQEAYRADHSIPARSNGHAGGAARRSFVPGEDIVETARALGLHLRYAPSMRNGSYRSDRGNAILSTLPLEDAVAVELPFVLQRRVAVGATVAAGGRRVRLYSAHLDPRGPIGHQWLGAAGRGVQAEHLLAAMVDDPTHAALPHVLGADLNLGRGRRERAWRLLAEAGFAPGVPPRAPSWRHTFHGMPRLVLDYILVRGDSAQLAGAQVRRLDEQPGDAGPSVFGSDHHPLLARLDFHPVEEASR